MQRDGSIIIINVVMMMIIIIMMTIEMYNFMNMVHVNTAMSSQ